MSSKHGLSVDQILSMQVVLANGTFVTVTEETDSDLFWALRGSGGCTYTDQPGIKTEESPS